MLKKAVIGMAFVMSALISWSGTYTEAKAETTGYRYYVDSSGGVNILEYIGKKKKVTIPAKIDGKDVVSVKGFKNTPVTSVTIPNSVTSIGDQVYEDNPYFFADLFSAAENTSKSYLNKMSDDRGDRTTLSSYYIFGYVPLI